MARRREQDGPALIGVTPPEELIWYQPTEPGRWTADDFARWLRARAAWRSTHLDPLPNLPVRERVRAAQHDLPAALVAAEKAGSQGAPNPPYRPAGPVVDRPQGGPGTRTPETLSPGGRPPPPPHEGTPAHTTDPEQRG